MQVMMIMITKTNKKVILCIFADNRGHHHLLPAVGSAAVSHCHGNRMLVLLYRGQWIGGRSAWNRHFYMSHVND